MNEHTKFQNPRIVLSSHLTSISWPHPNETLFLGFHFLFLSVIICLLGSLCPFFKFPPDPLLFPHFSLAISFAPVFTTFYMLPILLALPFIHNYIQVFVFFSIWYWVSHTCQALGILLWWGITGTLYCWQVYLDALNEQVNK